jgi:hypothetical protein
VYKNCNPGLALRVYQMTYTSSFEEDRYLATMQREADAFKKLIEDRGVSRCRSSQAHSRAWSFPSSTTTREHPCATTLPAHGRHTPRVTLEAEKMRRSLGFVCSSATVTS